jgi:hydrogenase large subunit
VYVPDLLAIAGYYKDWLHGGGLASTHLLAYGDLPRRANDYSDDSLMMPSGAIVDGKLHEVHDVDIRDLDEIKEYVDHAWFAYDRPGLGLHPWEGVTEPRFGLGPKAQMSGRKIDVLDEEAKYSFIKAPRWKGHAMEVGPLARLVIGYMRGREDTMDLVDGALRKLDLPITALFSTLGRTAARGLECLWAAKQLRAEQDKLIARLKMGDTATANTDKWDPSTWPKSVKGVGFSEAPRGALGHWIEIQDAKIENYQCVVPTTWNASPRDSTGRIGAYEASLLGTPMADPEQPLEILRTLHSFDPCLACSTHVMSPDGEELTKVKVR